MNTDMDTDIYSKLLKYSDFKYDNKFSTVENYYMYIIVNGGLKMQKGKIASQVGHAVQKVTEYCLKECPKLWKKYNSSCTPKIVLKTQTEEELLNVIDKTEDIFKCYVIDAGKTQIKPNSLTAVGYIPMSKECVPTVLNDLKLL